MSEGIGIMLLFGLVGICLLGLIIDPPSSRKYPLQNTVQVTKQDLPKTTDRLIAN